MAFILIPRFCCINDLLEQTQLVICCATGKEPIVDDSGIVSEQTAHYLKCKPHIKLKGVKCLG